MKLSEKEKKKAELLLAEINAVCKKHGLADVFKLLEYKPIDGEECNGYAFSVNFPHLGINVVKQDKEK